MRNYLLYIIPCKDSTINPNGKGNARKRLTASPTSGHGSGCARSAEHPCHASTARKGRRAMPQSAPASAPTDCHGLRLAIPGFNTSFSDETDVTKRHLPMEWMKNKAFPHETRHFGNSNGTFQAAICDVLRGKMGLFVTQRRQFCDPFHAVSGHRGIAQPPLSAP